MTRQLTDDVVWINESHGVGDRREHVSVYLVQADAGTVLVDSGSYHHRAAIEAAIDAETDGRGIDAIVLSHTDYPHSGNVSEFLAEWPGVDLIASSGAPEVQGLPEDARKGDVGGQLEVLDRTFSFIDPPLVDRSHTMWIFDDGSDVLFSVDGFGCRHRPDDRDKTADELDGGVAFDDIYAYHRDTFVWLRYAQAEALERALRDVLETYAPRWVAPVHGHPIPASHLEGYLTQVTAAVDRIYREYEVPG